MLEVGGWEEEEEEKEEKVRINVLKIRFFMKAASED